MNAASAILPSANNQRKTANILHILLALLLTNVMAHAQANSSPNRAEQRGEKDLPILVMGYKTSVEDSSAFTALGLPSGVDLVAKEYSDDEIDPKKYQAAILLWGPHYTGITSNGPPKFENSAGRVYSFCKEGRRAVIMFTGSVATSNEYLRPFGVAVVRNHDVLGKDVRSFDGSKICWLFNELTLGSYGNGKVDAYLQTNGSELEKTEFNGKTMSALMPVGQGDVLFLVQPSYNPGGWESPYGTLLYNKTLDQWDCKEAALRLLRFVKKM